MLELLQVMVIGVVLIILWWEFGQGAESIRRNAAKEKREKYQLTTLMVVPPNKDGKLTIQNVRDNISILEKNFTDRIDEQHPNKLKCLYGGFEPRDIRKKLKVTEKALRSFWVYLKSDYDHMTMELVPMYKKDWDEFERLYSLSKNCRVVVDNERYAEYMDVSGIKFIRNKEE